MFLSICNLAPSNQSQHDFGRKQRGKASGPHPNLPPAGEGATPKAWLFALAHPPLGEGWDGGWHPSVAAAPAPLGVVHAVDVPPVLLQWTPRKCWPCRSPARHCCHCARCGTARLALQASVMDAVISPTGRSPDVLVYLPLAGRKSFWTVLPDPVIADIVAFMPLDFLVFAFCAIGLYFLTCRPSSEYLACVFTSIQMREPRRLSDFRHRSVLEERRSQIRPQRGQFLPDLLAHSRSYGPKRR